MDVREKLVELLNEKQYHGMAPWAHGMQSIGNKEIADHLIAHGVTVQEEAKLYWKPVKPGEWNLTCSACDSHLGCREDANFCPECGAKFVYPKAVAPQPPKRRITMNDREKLADMMIELKGYLEEIYEFPTLDFFLKELAMQLIANGVTFATDNNDGGKWISVTEKLPENICPVLVALEGISTAFNGWYHDGKWWTVGAGTRPFTQKVTHWMPLPKPPKGD